MRVRKAGTAPIPRIIPAKKWQKKNITECVHAPW
jgi:hypothetical protein